MMDFRTRVHIPASDISIDHSTEMMLFGSCFSENIGEKLIHHKFPVEVNPFGILYNPLSVSTSIRRILQHKNFAADELIFHNGRYHSLMHHGSFSHTEKNECLKNISERFEKAADSLYGTKILLLTWGTSYAYLWKKTGNVVGNCHKFPADSFHRIRLSAEEITKDWSELIPQLQHTNPTVKIVFTVSPIRHWKDGAHENQISKSILHLAISYLQEHFGNTVYYFPAYEIMMDELRDYRFYAEDMMHPSAVAIDYLWERFSEAYFSDETKKINGEWSQIRRSLEHRPFNPETEAYRNFLQQTAQKLHQFCRKYPFIGCGEEKERISTLLKSN